MERNATDGAQREPIFMTGLSMGDKRSWLSMALCLASVLLMCRCAAVTSLENGGEKVSYRRVDFVFKGLDAKSVCVMGTFNGWDASRDCMTRDGSTWRATLFLAPGRYKYNFIIDGRKVVPDPESVLIEDSGFGTKNSVLIVE